MDKLTEAETKELVKDVKIISKLHAKWKDTRDKAKEAIMLDLMNIEISKAIIEIADKRIAIEKEKFK